MTPYHDPTGDENELRYFCYLAAKFEADPSLLERPLRTLERWLVIDHHGAGFLFEWKRLIEGAAHSLAGMERLTRVLRADDEDTRMLKGFAPFPGTLSRQERRQFLCASRH